jgi:hypothetical protein
VIDMAKKLAPYDINPEERFLSDATLDLRQGLITYVYKESTLDKLKQIFSDLDIRKNEFYWTVRNKEMDIKREHKAKIKPLKMAERLKILEDKIERLEKMFESMSYKVGE